MNFHKIKMNTPLSIMMLLTVVGVSAYFLLFYTIKGKNEEASVLASQIDLVSKKQEKILSSKKLLFSTEEERGVIDSAFVNQDSAVSFIEKLESLGKISGVETSFSTVDVDAKQKNILRVNMKTNGTFSSTYYLLSLVESLPYEVEVKRFYISRVVDSSKNKKTKDMWQGDMSIELSSYLSK